jgi:hypothetical protein
MSIRKRRKKIIGGFSLRQKILQTVFRLKKGIHWNSVIENHFGPAIVTIGVGYNWVDLCAKSSFGTKIFARYNWVIIITVFATTEFYWIDKNIFLVVVKMMC